MAERRFPTPEYGKHHKTQLDTADLRIVSSDEKVLDFPKAEIASEEKARRASGIAERLRDPPCRRSSDQASGCLAARLQGGAIRGRVCAFLTPEPNIRTLKRGGGEKT